MLQIINRSDMSADKRLSRILEICTFSADMSVAAEQAGADRIELCAALEVGGLTPSWGMIAETVHRVSIPVHVLIRPRAGDFCYTPGEFAQMVADIDAAKRAGANGIVAGILLPDGGIDVSRTRQLVERARPLSFTFHRAFDFAREPQVALENVIATGVDRLLTSGQQNTAHAGMGMLAQLVRQAGERIIVMPGAGIDAENVAEIRSQTGAREIHMSARQRVDGSMSFRPANLSLGREDEYSIDIAKVDKIRDVKYRSGL